MNRIRTALAAIALVLCTGWSCTRPSLPVPAQCNPICRLSCAENGDSGVRWTADPNSPAAWDELGGEVIPLLTGKLQTCEVRRQACEQCLQRLDAEGVIKL